MINEYQVKAPDILVDSGKIVGFIAGFPPGMRDTGIHILEKHGIVDVRRGGWQPLQPWLNAMREISERFDSRTLFQIGKRAAPHVCPTSDRNEPGACFSKFDELYREAHKGELTGGWEYEYEEVEGRKIVTLTSTCHYPCSFDLGLITGIAELCKPDSCSNVTVRHDRKGPCRSLGARFCVYKVVWT